MPGCPVSSTKMADFQAYFTLFLAWLFSVIAVRSILNVTRAKSRRPPGPIALPVIGHLHLLAPIPHQALHKLSLKYGPLMHLFLGSVPCVVASSPDIAKQFLKTHETSFSNRPTTAAIDFLTYGSADFSFAPYGPYWKFMKKLCMSELLGGRALDHFLPVRRQEITRFLQVIMKKSSRGEAVDVGAELVVLTNNIISRMLMNQICSGSEAEGEEVRRLVQETAKLTGRFNLSDYIWLFKNMDVQGLGKSLKRVRDQFDSMMERIIKEHEEAGNEKEDDSRDLLDILLDIAKDETSEMSLSKENIKAFALDIFAAGTDTSAVTTEWAMAELINQPNIMQKAKEEIDSVVGKSKLVEESDIQNLPFLQAIVKETLRLHPVGPLILRESSESCKIDGYEIPANTRLFVNVWAIGRDPNSWENALEFQPKRFLSPEGKSQLDLRGQHFHLLPFGSGRRGCPGTTLALQVVQTTLAAMVQCFEWKAEGGAETVSMEEAPGLTLPRAHPLICIPASRLTTLSFM